jgi:tight adherence protein B
MTVVALVFAAATAALLVSPAGAPLVAGAGSTGRRRTGIGPRLAVLVAMTAGALVVTVDGLHLALALVVLGSAGGVGVLVGRSRRARATETRQSQVVEVAEALAGELRAGQPPVVGLEHCAEVWPAFGSVVSAARLGADVPSALRRLAERPGAEGLREVASAWQVSQRSGAGLATALSQVADTARARQAARHVVRGELASAQATARLVAGLPVVSLAMSAGIGGDPWHFLLATAPGLVCLALGALLAFAGLVWIDRIAAGVLRG